MKRLIVFVGESGSGKTTIMNTISGLYPDKFMKVVTCTSRPMRNGEVNGIDYYFMPSEFFKNNLDLELVKNTSDGYYYGTRRLDLFSNSHHLLLSLRYTGIKKLLESGLKNITIVHISINSQLKIKRMRQRGDSDTMILNRLKTDLEDDIPFDSDQAPTIFLDGSQEINSNVKYLIERMGE